LEQKTDHVTLTNYLGGSILKNFENGRRQDGDFVQVGLKNNSNNNKFLVNRKLQK